MYLSVILSLLNCGDPGVGECFGGETHGEFVEEFEIAESDKISKRKNRE